MKIIFISLLVLLLSGCSLIINRGSIQQSDREHYVEIYSGAFTTEGVFLEALSEFSNKICGGNDYNITKNHIVSAIKGRLPGMTCELRGCESHQVMQVKVVCGKTPFIQIIPKQEDSRWLAKDKFEGFLNSDRVTQELVSQIGEPKSIYFNGNEEIIWRYPDRKLTVYFERTLALTGYRTHKMILKYESDKQG